MGLHRVGHDWSDLAAAACISLTVLRFPFSSVFSSYIYYHVPRYSFLLIYHAWSSQVFLNFWLDVLHGFRKFQPISFLSSFLLFLIGKNWVCLQMYTFRIFLPFHTAHGVLKARMLKWFAIPFSSGPHFVRTLHHDPSVLGGPTRPGSEFHWVRQGCSPCDQFG